MLVSSYLDLDAENTGKRHLYIHVDAGVIWVLVR